MKEYKVPIQSLIDHIKTAHDVDPWAKEMAEELLKEQETKFICNLLGGQPYEVYCRECRTIVCQLSKCDTMDTVKRVFNFCPQYGRVVKWNECNGL